MISAPVEKSEERLVREAAQSWETFWARTLSPQFVYSGRGFRPRLKAFIRRGGGFELACRIADKALGKPRGKLILEAGSGSGEMGLRMAIKGNRVVMMDTSPAGLLHAKRRTQDLQVDTHPVRASVFHLPFKSDVFGGVFNAGVLDHFGPDYRRRALSEMIRVAKTGRRIAVLTNDARSFVHPRAMKHAQRKGTWPHGYKAALSSLRAEVKSADTKCKVKELSRGFISQFEFLRYYLPPESSTVRLFFWFYFVISLPLSFLNYFPGQYLVTVIEKSDEA